ncbi:LAQU0S03e03048g1_1 [Lachancea quebecensis]|uniref:LAQU0S03e03048g1_1 n=1 Tax=Lachancea quebecensis TaxID=1654605 RepID=A0A0P1KPL1_9SACH|nr:LAQU0S03e03048g1_1 [Lachancea quebecensis]
MYVPVMTSCGHNYCYECISNWLVSNNANELTCPQCRSPLKEQPALNVALQNLLNYVLDSYGIGSSQNDSTRAESVSKYRDDSYLDRLFKNVFNNTAMAVVDDDDGVARCSNCHWEVEGDICPHCSARMRNRAVEEEEFPSDEYSEDEIERIQYGANRGLGVQVEQGTEEQSESDFESDNSNLESQRGAFDNASGHRQHGRSRRHLDGSQHESEDLMNSEGAMESEDPEDSDLDSFIVNEEEEDEIDGPQEEPERVELDGSDHDSDFYEHHDIDGFVSGDSLENDSDEGHKKRKRRIQVVLDSDEDD